MKPYTKFTELFETIEFPTIRTNKKIEYVNLPCGFDIETTSTTHDGAKAAFMYIWAIGIGHGGNVYYGRTWEQFAEVCELLQDRLELHEDRRLVIYIHNLGYEFQFMRKYFDWLEVFAVAERKPLKAFCSYGIEFRCSYMLSGFSLANTAKNLVKHKIKKMVGDLDYSLTRTHETKLDDLEMGYVKNDIVIITAYIDEQLDIYKDVSKIPMTNTGRVRTLVRNECYYETKNGKRVKGNSSRGKWGKYRKIMDDLTINPETYIQLKRAFMGGFTHANANYSGQILENVTSIDFTSAYPAVMCAEKFPMSRFRPVEIKNVSELNELSKTHALLFNARFKNIKCKIAQETYLSESKTTELINPVINNGRVFSADVLTTTLTDVDYEIMLQVYEWETIEVNNVQMAYKNYLPRSIIKSILDLYQGKTELKDVKGSEVEYMLSKGMLNSIYGMCVTDIVKDNSIYAENWEVEKVDLLEEIDKYNTSKNRFLFYAWGLWVTAYARRNLWTGILAVGNDYVYSDTDSLKLLNYEKHKPYISWFDNNLINKLNSMCDYYKFDKKLLSPKTVEGETKMLGVWDYEGTYSRFKTLGAKRYILEEGGKLQLTVAGLSKQNGLNYMLEQANGCNTEVFKQFDDNLYIPANKTGKMTHTYIDDEYKFQVKDYKGRTTTVNPLSSIHLGECDFTLSISNQYNEFLHNLSNGILYTGLTHL